MPSGSTGGRPYEVTLRDSLYSNDRQAEFTIDATQALGTVWIRSPVEIEPGVNYEGSLRLEGYTADSSYNKISTLRAYVGPDRPQETDDFPSDIASWRYYNEVGGLETNPWETAGWDQYEQLWETPAYDTDELHLAIGFQTNWEVEFGHLLDNVTLELTPK